MMEGLIFLVELVSNIFFVLLLARIFLPIIGVDPYQPIMQVIFRLTEPVLAPIRAILPQAGGLDFSPMVAMILLTVLQSVLMMLLRG
jgi:YggT family protein